MAMPRAAGVMAIGMAMHMIMVVIMVMVAGAAAIVISPGLGRKAGVVAVDLGAQALDHGDQDMVVANPQPAAG